MFTRLAIALGHEFVTGTSHGSTGAFDRTKPHNRASRPTTQGFADWGPTTPDPLAVEMANAAARADTFRRQADRHVKSLPSLKPRLVTPTGVKLAGRISEVLKLADIDMTPQRFAERAARTTRPNVAVNRLTLTPALRAALLADTTHSAIKVYTRDLAAEARERA